MTDPNAADDDHDRTIPRHRGAGSTPPKPAPSGAPPPRIPGVVLGDEIARGGMGVVYRGEQQYLARKVAVKVLANYLDGDEFVQRFQREARILAGISHPHIVACHDAGSTDDRQCYLVMEFVDGPTLRSHCDRNGPLPVPAALRVLRDIAQALQHAHQLGIIHRDVKPENVLLQRDERRGEDFPFVPKLVDLGLARQQAVDSQVTAPGVVMGTTSTMAPEQFDDPDHVDHRADIYGLGCVAYHALVGKPAFGGGTMMATMAQKAQRLGPDPQKANPKVPPEIATLVQRMLAHAAADRPQGYGEIIDLCVRVLGSTGERTTITTARRAAAPQRSGVVTAVLLAVAVGAVGAYAAYQLPIGSDGGGGSVPAQPPVDPRPAPPADGTKTPGPPPTEPPRAVEPDPSPATTTPAPEPVPPPVAPAPPREPERLPAFGPDLTALGWSLRRPEGMRAAAFMFAEGAVMANCNDGEAVAAIDLPPGTALLGTLELKPADFGQTGEGRAVGVRVLAHGTDPVVVWLAPDADGAARASLGQQQKAWPPQALLGADGAPRSLAIAPGDGDPVLQFAVDHGTGKVGITFSAALDDPTQPRDGAGTALSDDYCRVEVFVRNGTARLADFTLVR